MGVSAQSKFVLFLLLVHLLVRQFLSHCFSTKNINPYKVIIAQEMQVTLSVLNTIVVIIL